MNLENGLFIDIVNEDHFVANDSCNQHLEKSPIDIKEKEDNIVEHHNGAIVNGAYGFNENIKRVDNLLYFSMGYTDTFFKLNKTLPFTCPVCNKKYKLLREDYLKLKREYKK
jgi:hypothetical protein